MIGMSSKASIIFSNQSCQECLCRIASNSLALNCFPNNTCEVFSVVPRRYQLTTINGTKLIFPTGVLPNISRCCQPNLTDVFNKLQNGSRKIVTVNTPRCIILTDHGSIVTPDTSSRFLRGFDATNFTPTIQIPLNISSNTLTLAQHAGAYYIGYPNSPILVINMSDSKILNSMNLSAVNGVRDMIFLDDGETMVVASSGSNLLSFFKANNSSTHNYTFFHKQPVNYVNPHGLLYVNDTFFYATAWVANQLYSYEKINETFWRETLIIDARPWTNSSGGHHVMIDECDRFWYALGNAGVLVFDHNGTYLGKTPMPPLTSAFDAIITENYILYVSDIISSRLIRIDPNIMC